MWALPMCREHTQQVTAELSCPVVMLMSVQGPWYNHFIVFQYADMRSYNLQCAAGFSSV